jgi:hypothetical protein
MVFGEEEEEVGVVGPTVAVGLVGEEEEGSESEEEEGGGPERSLSIGPEPIRFNKLEVQLKRVKV